MNRVVARTSVTAISNPFVISPNSQFGAESGHKNAG
jgi:hypothetical protein